MIMTRRGIISLPVKLTVSLMIIALMVPPISALAESIQDDMEQQELYDAAYELKEEIYHVFTKSPSYVTYAELSIPDGCYLALGGEEGTVIRMYSPEGLVGGLFMDASVGGDDIMLSGDVILELSNDIDGEQKVMVREI